MKSERLLQPILGDESFVSGVDYVGGVFGHPNCKSLMKTIQIPGQFQNSSKTRQMSSHSQLAYESLKQEQIEGTA